MTTLTTRGYLSNGISEAATLHGGIGRDSFTVYRNKAELFLLGEEDDDSFRIRAFVKVDPSDPKAPFTNINGGQGADFISFTVNAPVRVEGGDGFDSLTVVGTEFGDDFVVSDQGVFGAGLFVTYATIEKLVVDALEGNDRFFIVSTPEGVAMELVGGLGTDTFNVGGGNDGRPITVVSRSLEGHSGLIDHNSISLDYNNIFIQDLSVKVADNDAAGVVMQLEGPLRVFEAPSPFAPTSLVQQTYRVVLTRSPVESIRITAAPSALRERDERAGGKGIKLAANAPSGSNLDLIANAAGVTLVFDRTNWFLPQTITVVAEADTLAEGRQSINIQHSVVQGGSQDDGGAYDRLAVPSLTVDVIDDDAAAVLVLPSGSTNLISEGWAAGATNPTDTYSVVLTKAPTGPVTIQLTSDGQLLTLNGALATLNTLTFLPDDWFTPQTVTVRAVQDSTKEGFHYSRIQHQITSSLSDFIGVTGHDVLRGLAAGLNSDLSNRVKASVSGGEVVLSGPAFTLLAGTNASLTGSTRAFTEATLTLTGAVVVGTPWTLRLNGTPFSITAETASLTDAALLLEAEINQVDGYTATASGATLTIVPDGGAPFSAALTEGTGTIVKTGESTTHYVEARLLLDNTTDVSRGDVWSMTLNGVAYRYVAGSNKENYNPASIDFRIADDDVPGVIVSQTGGSTNVIEPSNWVVLGGGFVTSVTSSGGQNTRFIGDFGTSVLNEIALHDSIYTAQDIDLGKWSKVANTDVANATSVPHLTILGKGNADTDFYKFSLASTLFTNVGDTVTATFDVDHGYDAGDAILWGSRLKIYDADGRVIAQGPGVSNPFLQGAGGSTTWLDDFLQYTFTAPGTYYVEVSNWLSFGGMPPGVDYQLQVSMEGHLVDGFIFAPEPIAEAEPDNNTAQNIETGNKFFTFYDLLVGNQHLGGSIDFQTPYARIQGSGDGSFDIFQFEITTPMLNPPALRTLTGSADTESYFTSISVLLNGPVTPGDEWTINLRYINYSYEVQPGETTLTQVAEGLKDALPARYTTTVTGSTLKIEDANGFTLGGVTQFIRKAGDVTRSVTPLQTDESPVHFYSVDVALTGTPAADELWVIALDGTEYPFESPSTSLDAVAAGLLAAIPNTYTKGLTGTTLTISSATPFTAEFLITGEAPTGTATITGTPVQTELPLISFNQAIFALNGGVTEGDKWVITVNGTERSVTVDSNDDLPDVALKLKNSVDALSGYTASLSGSPDLTTVTVNRTAPFTAALEIRPVSAVISTTPKTALLTVTGTVTIGETWAVRLDGTDYTFPAATTSLNDMATGLAVQLNGVTGYTSVAEGATISLTKLAGGTITVLDPVRLLTGGTVDTTTPKSVMVVLGGSSGGTWTVTVAGVTGSPFTATGASLTAVATSLAGQIDALADYAASFESTAGSTVTMTITRISAAVPAVTAGTSGSGSATVNTTTVTAAVAALSGTVVVGDIWTLTLDGVEYSRTAATTVLGDLATAFATQLNGLTDFTAAKEGNSVVISKFAGAALTLTGPVRRADAGSVNTTTAHTESLTLVDTPVTDDVWTIHIDTTNYSHPVTTGQSVTDVIAALVTLIQPVTGFTVGVKGGTLALTSVAGTNFTLVFAVTPGSMPVAGRPDVSWIQTVDFSTAPAVALLDQWTLEVDGDSYPVSASTTVLTDVIDDFVSDIDDPANGINAERVGNSLVITATDGAVLPVGALSRLRAVAATESAPVADNVRKHYFNAEVELDGAFAAGETWSISIGGHIYDYPVPTGLPESQRNLTTVASGLVDAINAIVSGSNRGPYRATLGTGGKFTVTERSGYVGDPADQGTFTVALLRGGGKVHGVFDIDRSNLVSGVSRVLLFQILNIAIYDNYSYLISPALELIGPSGAVLKSDWYGNANHSLVVDAGSASNRDPFLEYDFYTPGLYKLRVRSYIDYLADNPYFRDGLMDGVAAGQAYELNLSIQQHPPNTDAIALADPVHPKTITIVGGAGLGQSAIITGYNAETKEYTLNREWNPAPDATSRFEISYRLVEEFSGTYAPVLDTYSLVLTSQPLGDIVIDVTPQMTRTYNSEEAFNAAANRGENEAVQVRVATNRARVTMQGGVITNETWSLTLTNSSLSAVTPVNVPVAAGTSLTALRNLFISAVNSAGGYEAVADPDDAEALIITATGGGSFFVESNITPETRGNITATGTVGVAGWRKVEVEFAGEIAEGEQWTLTLDGLTFSHTAGFRDTLAGAVQGIKSAIAGSLVANTYDVVARGRTLTINRRDGADFTISYSITPDSQGSVEVTPQLVFTSSNWNTPQIVTVMAIDDDVVDGSDALVFPAPEERVNTVRGPITVDGGVRVQEERFLNNPFTLPGESNYPLEDGTIESLGAVDGQVTITDSHALHTGPVFGLRPGFDPRINSSTYALTILDGLAKGVEGDLDFVSENILTVSRSTAFAAAFSYSGLGSAERMVFRGVPERAQLASINWLDVTVELAGSVQSGETWTMTLDGTPYEVTAYDSDLLSLINALDAAIPSTFNLSFTSSVLGTRLAIEAADGSAFSFDFSISAGSEIQSTVRGTPVQSAIGSVQWREASFFLSGELLVGDVWTVTVDGDDASYTVLSPETTVGTMMEDLVSQVLNEFQPGISGDTITLLLPWPEDAETGSPLAPVAGDAYFYAPINLNTRVIETTQVDTLNVFNGQSPANDEGVLTEDRLTGLGMGGDTFVGDKLIRGGIEYRGLEALRIELGTGDDTLTIESTHQGSTVVTTGAGADAVIVKTIGGHTRIETGAGDDAILVSSNDLLVDQITGLLTLDGGGGQDSVTVDDSGDGNPNTGTLTRTTLTGLDMPMVPEVQRVFVQAASGTYRLRTDGFGIESELGNTDGVYRFAGYAEVTLDFEMTLGEVQDALRALYGSVEIEVTEVRTPDDVTYTIAFLRTLAGRDFAQLVWGDTRGTTSLIASSDASINVITSTVRDGTTAPTRDTVQIVSVTATGGTFRIGFRLDADDSSVVSWTGGIAFDASAEALLAALNPLLNPNNGNLSLPHTDNVAVSRHGSAYHILLQGEHRELLILDSDLDATALTGTVALATQVEGIAYYGVENLEIDLGSGADVLHVASTGAATTIYSAAGTDTINVRTIDHPTVIFGGADDDLFNVGSQFGLSSQPSTLNGISGWLTVNGEAQTGQDILTVDDSADSIVNIGRVSTTRILGLGMAQGIIYGTIDRLNLHLGSGADILTIYSTHGNESNSVERALNKETFVTAGGGNDTINVGNSGVNIAGIPVEDLLPGVDNVGDLLDIEGMAGDDTLNINDRIDSSNNLGRQLAGAVTDSTRPSRVSDSVIVGLDLTGRIGHFAFEILNVLLGTGDDTFVIEVGEITKDETNVFGGPGNDHITFFDGQFITGILDGEAGLDDTVDYALWSGSITVNMLIGRATGIRRGFDGGILNVENALGGRSKDFLIGGGADNELDGNEQDDFIQGGFGDDTLEGGSGNDVMEGGIGNDWYVLVPGSDDRVIDVAGHDTFDFSRAVSAIRIDLRRDDGQFQTVDAALNRIAILGVIEDVIGSDFDDDIQGNSADNEVWAGLGVDQVRGGSGSDVLHGGGGTDTLNGESGNDELFGDADADTLYGFENDDTLHGGSGNDRLFGNSGNDLLAGDEGDDVLDGDAGNDLLILPTALIGVTVDLPNRTATDGLGGTDALVSIEGAIGTSFVDQFTGDETANEFHGGGGNDIIAGAGGSDLISGDAGLDTLNGGEGSDDFIWVEGDESDDIDAGTGGSDLLRVTLGGADDLVSIETVTVGASQLRRTRGGAFSLNFANIRYVELNTAGGNDEVSIFGEVLPTLLRITVDAGAGDDEVVGGSFLLQPDSGATVPLVVRGGDGADRFYSGMRSDRFDGGDGFDTVNYSLSPAAVTAKLPAFREVTDREGVTTIVPVEGRVTNDGYRSRDTLVWVEELVGSFFADKLTGGSLNDVIRGGGGNDKIYGGAGNDQIFGDEGLDTLYGDAGDDVLDGGADNDSVRGGLGNDMVRGGLGDDSLRGDAGNDSYSHEAGSDLITADILDVMDYSNSPAPITVDLLANKKYGTAADGTGDIDRLVKVAYLVGSTFNDTLLGDSKSNTFVGGLGDDTIDGRLGDDRIIWNDGDGVDILAGGGGTRDVLEIFGSAVDGDVLVIDSQDVTTLRITRSNLVPFIVTGAGFENLRINTLGGNDSVTVAAFATPLVMLLTVELGSGNDSLNALAALMPLLVNGGEGDDTIIGGTNRDTLKGGAGRDTIDYSGAASAIKARVNSTVTRAGAKNDVDKLLEFERLIGSAFNDRITASGNVEILAMGGDDRVTVSLGTNTIDGGDGNDVLVGGSGADLLIGGPGNDTLSGNRGADRLRGGSGNDRLDGGGDRIGDFADYSDATVGVRVDMVSLQGRDTFDGSVGVDTFVRINGVIGSAFDDVITGDALANELRGGAGDDQLEGGAGNDILIGEAGDDDILGGNGDDVVIWNLGDGDDVVEGGAGINVGRLAGSSVDGDIVSLSANGAAIVVDWNAGADRPEFLGFTRLELSLGGGNDLATVGSLAATGVASITLFLGEGDDTVDATTTDVALLVFGEAGNDEISGGTAVDVLHGGDGNDQIAGGAGDDSITGDAGDDVLEGESGNDLIEGNDGADVLVGGANNDRLEGGRDSDTYILPDGVDRIRDVEGDFDLLVFSSATVAVHVDLAIREGTVQIVDTLGNGIAISGRLIAVIGSNFDDEILGDSGDNWIDGGEGNDLIDGRSGDDRLYGSDGDDVLTGGEGADLLVGGEGDDELNGDSGADELMGEAGNDRLVGGTGNDILVGDVGNDSVLGEDGDDVVDGGDGDDTIDGGSGDDRIDAGTGDDNVTGASGNDLLIGWAGNDRVDGGEGDDRVFGDDGDDVLFGRAANDDIDGGAGDDKMIPGSGVNEVRGGHGTNEEFGEGNSPVGVADAFTVSAGASNVALDVLANDSFAPDFEEILRVVSVGTTSAGGVVTIGTAGLLLRYTPAVGFTGTETFTYVLGDGTTAPAVTVLVTITVTL